MLSGLLFVFTHPLNRKYPFKTLMRVLGWKINQRFFSWPIIVPLVGDIKFICYPHLSFSGLIVYTKWPDFSEWQFLSNFIKSKSVFIDVGSHSGDYSLFAASKITAGKIFAFEPDLTVLPCLYENVFLNSLGKMITVIPKAVGDKDGETSFTQTVHSETSHLTTAGEKRNTTKKIVTMTTLDTFAKENKLTKIDVLKIDVEGAEGLVLKGAKKLLSQEAIDLILFELNPNHQQYGDDAGRIINILKKNNYLLCEFAKDDTLKIIDSNVVFAQTVNLVALNQKTRKRLSIKH